MELSESFVRGDAIVASEKERPKVEEQSLQNAVAIQAGKAIHPLEDPKAPIALDILYDDQPVRVTVKDGRARVPEPKEGQRVSFAIRRLDASSTNYAVVLKVNGENVLFRQRMPDFECRCYVLYANSAPVLVPGFQKDDGSAEQLVVLSRAESKEKEIHYGTDVGMITMTVFRELKGRPAVEVHDEMAEVAVLQQMPTLTARAKKPSDLRAKLIEDANRGLLDAGTEVKSEIRRVKFLKDPTPVMCVAIQYYKP